MSTVGAQYAGDVDIQEALLVSPTGNITDLTKDVIINEINIFEDMFRSSISGNMVITDTNDIVTKVPIVGQEYLTLKIVTPTLRLERDMIDFTDNPFAVHKVTLRKDFMYEFLERLCAVALPRTRDFRGLSFKSFDGMGNYSFGIKEQVVFAEIDYDKVDSIRGMDVIITTSSSNDDVCYELLRAMGLPIREKNVVNNIEEQDG